MTDEIIKLREELVGLSSNADRTRQLLDKLTVEENLDHDRKAKFIVRESEVLDSKDFGVGVAYRTRGGYVLDYRGGYTIKVDERMLTPCSAIELLMQNEEAGTAEENDANKMAQTAVDMIFRLPMFVFSHGETTVTIAEIAAKYMLLLQQMGEVPTEETKNPEYDKFLVDMQQMLENLAIGLEKEGKEYERRNGISNGEKKIEGQGEDQGQGEAEA